MGRRKSGKDDDSKKANIQAHSVVQDPRTGKIIDLSTRVAPTLNVPPPRPTIAYPSTSTTSSSNTTTNSSIYPKIFSTWASRTYATTQALEYHVSWLGETMIFSRETPGTNTHLCAFLRINENNISDSLTQEYFNNLENYICNESKKSHFQTYNTDRRADYDDKYKEQLIKKIILEPKDIIQSPLYHVEENLEVLKILVGSSAVCSQCVLPFVKRLTVICLQPLNITKLVYSQGINVLVRLLQLFSSEHKVNEFSKEVIIQACFLSYQICKVDYETRSIVKRMGLFFELWKLAAEEPGVMRYNANEAIGEFSNDYSSIGQDLKTFVNNPLYSDMKIMVPLHAETHFMDTIFAHKFIFDSRCSERIFEENLIPSGNQIYILKNDISRKALLYFLQFLYSDSLEYFEEDRDRTDKSISWEQELKQGNIIQLSKCLYQKAQQKFNYLLGTDCNRVHSEKAIQECAKTQSYYNMPYTVAIPKGKSEKLNGKQVDKNAIKYSLVLEKDLYSYFEFNTYKSSCLDNLLPCGEGDRIFKVPKVLSYGDEEELVEDDEVNFVYYKAHCLILASRSDYFTKLLTSGFSESESQVIEIENCAAAAFEVVLRSLYCGEDEFQFCYKNYERADFVKTSKCKIDQSNAVEILVVSHMFMLSSLKFMAEKEILQGLTKQNASILLQIADAHNAPSVESACRKLITN